MAQERQIDAVVIGSGPGGYSCGIRLGQLGVKAAVIEKVKPGGVCLNVGCIPSKALIHAAKMYEKVKDEDKLRILGIGVAGAPTMDMNQLQSWKNSIVSKLSSGVEHLLKANGSELIRGQARLDGRSGEGRHRVVVEGGAKGEEVLLAKNVVIATGSRPARVPSFEPEGKFVLDSTAALALAEVPGRMVVLGGGYIGLEIGMAYAKLGSQIIVVEMADSLLGAMEPDCVELVVRELKKNGGEIHVQAKARSWFEKAGRAVVTVEKAGETLTLEADKILVSVGRKPNSDQLGLDKAGVAVERGGFIAVDSQLKTNVPGIYAIGDVNGGMMLAHKATKEAEICAEVISGHRAGFDVRCIPAVVFTDPEIASVGLTEREARLRGHEILVGKFPFAALGRALSVNDTNGFAKVIADQQSQEILGLHIVGNGASDLISEGALAIEMGAVVRDLALTVHPHPTLSESVMEAALASLGEAIHIVNRG